MEQTNDVDWFGWADILNECLAGGGSISETEAKKRWRMNKDRLRKAINTWHSKWGSNTDFFVQWETVKDRDGNKRNIKHYVAMPKTGA